MSQPFRLIRRKERYERANKLREQQEKRFHERLVSVGLVSVDNPQQQPQDVDNHNVGSMAHSTNSSSRIGDTRSMRGSNQRDGQSDYTKRLSTPQSSLVRKTSTDGVPRRVCFDDVGTDSKRNSRFIGSPASSISVSQSPIKPGNTTAGSKKHHQHDTHSSVSSLDERVEKFLGNYDNDQKPKAIDKRIEKKEINPKLVEMKDDISDFLPSLPTPDTTTDDNDEVDDAVRAWVDQMKAQAKLRAQEAEQLAQAKVQEQNIMKPSTDDLTEECDPCEDIYARLPRQLDEVSSSAKPNALTPPADPNNHPISAGGKIREVRYFSGKDLFDDSDVEVDEVTAKTTPEAKQKRKKTKQSQRNIENITQTLAIAQEDEQRITEDRKTLELQLKPDFTHPKFGPFELAPIILQRSNDNKVYTVPASIARYLPTYQRNGIEFLHAALSAGTGAVLGDDMGLGKTVQIIGLLTAFLAKSGTVLDVLELQRRRQLVAKAREEYKTQRDRALMNGTTLPDERSIIKSLNLPTWAPILLVVPTAVIQNWLNEFDVWGHFAVASYKGPKRSSQLEEIETGAAEVLLCGKNIFQKEHDFECLNKIDWKLIIIDELHDFKNGDSTISQNLRVMQKRHVKMRVIGMTGTLMQNQHKELWNLIDLVQPGFLGSWKEFDMKVARPIRNKMSKTSNVATEVNSDIKGDFIRKLGPIFLRRSKEIIADKLPQKEEFVVFCELSPLQKRIYQHMLTLPDFELLKKARAPCNCGVNQEFFDAYKKLRTMKERVHFQRTNKERIMLMKGCCYKTPMNRDRSSHIGIDPRAVLWRFQKSHDGDQGCEQCPYCILLPGLTKLLKVSSHAALLQIDRPLHSYTPGTSDYRSASKDLEFAKVAIPPEDLIHFPGKSFVREESIMDDHFMLSGKMKMLDELLKKHSAAGKRVLIFSPSTKSLDLIQNYIKANGYTFLRMDGSVQQGLRQSLIDEYQSNPNIFIFLLSTRATGVGINLTAANVVIIFDCDWNPSADAQAQDRAFRIGQVNDVQVFRLVSRGTIDELKYIRQIYKEQLKIETIGAADESAPKVFRGVQGDKDRKGELFGCENLLKYKDGSFMADFWKASDAKPSKTSAGVAMHSEGAFVNALRETTLGDIIGLESDQFRSFEMVASQGVKSNRLDDHNAVASDLPVGGNDEVLPVEAEAVHHGDFFRDDCGGAALMPGDEGYDEEMGGESQMIFEVCEQAGGMDTFDEPEPEPMSTQAVVSAPIATVIQSCVEIKAPILLCTKSEERNDVAPLATDSSPESKPSPLKSKVRSEAEQAVSAAAYPSPSGSGLRDDAVKTNIAQAAMPDSELPSGRDRVMASKRPGSLHQLELPAYLKKSKKK